MKENEKMVNTWTDDLEKQKLYYLSERRSCEERILNKFIGL